MSISGLKRTMIEGVVPERRNRGEHCGSWHRTLNTPLAWRCIRQGREGPGRRLGRPWTEPRFVKDFLHQEVNSWWSHVSYWKFYVNVRSADRHCFVNGTSHSTNPRESSVSTSMAQTHFYMNYVPRSLYWTTALRLTPWFGYMPGANTLVYLPRPHSCLSMLFRYWYPVGAQVPLLTRLLTDWHNILHPLPSMARPLKPYTIYQTLSVAHVTSTASWRLS